MYIYIYIYTFIYIKPPIIWNYKLFVSGQGCNNCCGNYVNTKCVRSISRVRLIGDVDARRVHHVDNHDLRNLR